MVSQEISTEQWGPRPGEDWRAHRMRVFADHPEMLAVLRVAKSREDEAEIWREWHVARAKGDLELVQLAREARFDLEAPPEEDEDDIRYIKNLSDAPDDQLSREFWRWFELRFPDQAGLPSTVA